MRSPVVVGGLPDCVVACSPLSVVNQLIVFISFPLNAGGVERLLLLDLIAAGKILKRFGALQSLPLRER
jgi:hypothetical protein